MTATPQPSGKKGAGSHAARAITKQRRRANQHDRRDSRSDMKTLAANGGHTASSEEIDAIGLGPESDGNVSDPDDDPVDDQDGCR
jgi:hypothetical protein